MKKALCILLVFIFLLSAVSGCAKSDAAVAVDNMIAAIGEVTLGNEQVIIDAEQAVARLEEKDLKQVESLAVLTEARNTYDNLVEEDKRQKITAVENVISAIGEVTLDSEPAILAARDAYDNCDEALKGSVSNYTDLVAAEEAYVEVVLNSEADKIEVLIDAIGEVTLDSKDAIDQAQQAYNKAEKAVRDHVENYQVLLQANKDYTAAYTDAQDTQAANDVIAKIDEIGTVSLEKEEVINNVQKAYNSLNANAKSKVTNYSILKEAVEKLNKLIEEKKEKTIKTLLGKMRTNTDAVNKITFYEHTTEPKYINTRSFVLPYIGKPDRGSIYLRIKYNYFGDDWVFFEKVIISIDGSNTTENVSYFNITRDNAYGDVWETYDKSASSSDIKLLRRIAESKETIIRFQGDHYYYDLKVSSKDKTAIKEVLDLYEAWGGK